MLIDDAYLDINNICINYINYAKLIYYYDVDDNTKHH
jgi:hypothetical protein